MLSMLVNIIAAPKLAYARLRDQPSILFPMLLLLATVSLTTFVYFHLADPDLLIEDMLEQAGNDMSDAERAEAREGMQSMPAGMFKWMSTISSSLGILLVFLLHAGYFYLTSMFNGTKIGYKAWLSFVSWSNIPVLFSSIASLATLLLATGYVPLLDLNPFTLSNLLGIDSDNPALRNTMANFDLTRLWSIAIMLIGYRVWTAKSWLHCSLVVLLPMLVIFGTMFLFAS